jgi:rod shape-determining protein MreC
VQPPSRPGGTRATLFKKPGQALGAGFFLFLSIVIFVSGKIENAGINKVRIFVGSAISPVVEMLGAPIIWFDNTTVWFSNLADIRGNNARLRAENEILIAWRDAAARLEIENRRLKNILAVSELEVPILTTARVIGVAGGPYVRSILIRAGAADGLRNGLPVVDQNGIVGRAILVGEQASRILLVSDLNSRVPVRVERTNDNAIVIGRNETLAELQFLPVNAVVEPGDRLLTSGDGRAFPPDMIVGIVEAIEGDTILVRLVAELDRLSFVSVLDYDPAALEPQNNDGAQ